MNVNIFFSRRMSSILMEIYHTDPLPLKVLTTNFEVSERTIRNDIGAINEVIKEYDSQIRLIKNKGYTITNKKNIDEIIHELIRVNENIPLLETSTQRISYLLMLFLKTKEYLSIDEICDSIYVSITTALNYIKEIKQNLRPYRMTIRNKTNIGYRLVGDEKTIRRYILEQFIKKNYDTFITEYSIEEQELFSNIDLQQLDELVGQSFPIVDYHLTDYNRKNFVLNLAISILRNDFPIESLPPNESGIPSEISVPFDNLLNTIEQIYHLRFPTVERNWLSSHLVIDIRHDIETKESPEIQYLVTAMLKDMKENFSEDLLEDKILFHDLVNHFRSYLSLREYLIYRKNPLLNDIKKSFAYAFELTMVVCQTNPIIKGYCFNESEISYIALHIESAIRRKDVKIDTKEVLLVCGNGVSTSRLIETVLGKRYKNKLKIQRTVSFAEYKFTQFENIDFVISTVPLNYATVPVVQVNFLDLESSFAEIDKLLKDNDERFNKLKKLFDEEFLIMNPETVISNRQEAITLLTKEMATDELSETLITQVLDREKMAATNLSPYIAIPHTINPDIQQSKIGILIQKEPIIWNDRQTVHIVFLLLVDSKNSDYMQTFFEFLSELIESKELQVEFTRITSFDELLVLMRKTIALYED